MDKFSDLKDQTLLAVDKSDDQVIFTTSQGRQYRLYHRQDCCEDVRVEDVVGNLADLIHEPLLMAEEAVSDEAPTDIKQEYQPVSQLWTFYKLATIKGYVTIRWYGSSSGYYSEKVDFERLPDLSIGDLLALN